MLGAIIGDIVGSTREWHNIKTEDFELVPRGSRFTDDTVMTLAVAEWLRACGAARVVVHFDLDVLDPAEIIAGVGVVPDGMKIDEVVSVINTTAREKELVGLTVAEPMPRTAIRIKQMLSRLPLLG